jgi:hypothetical protein
MSRVVITIESTPGDSDGVTISMEAEPPFKLGQKLMTHDLGVAGMSRIQQKALGEKYSVASSHITRADGVEIDDTEWARGWGKKKRPWWRFWG